jgi:hypothetical protein
LVSRAYWLEFDVATSATEPGRLTDAREVVMSSFARRAGNRGARGLIDESITPIWEANHVRLVFDLVIFWTAFPRAFASVMTALALPIWLAAGGIVLRGAGFAFRKEITRAAAGHRGDADQCRRHAGHLRGAGRRGHRRRDPRRPLLRPAA